MCRSYFLVSVVFTVIVISEEGTPVRNICPANLSMLLWKGTVSGSYPPSTVSHSICSLFWHIAWNHKGESLRMSRLEVCTGSKLKPEPGPYPRSSDPTRPDRAAQLNLEPEPDPKSPPPQRITKKRKRLHFTIACKENGLIKALPFHKHLPVMKVCEHQVQRSHTFSELWILLDKKMMTVQIMVIFVS